MISIFPKSFRSSILPHLGLFNFAFRDKNTLANILPQAIAPLPGSPKKRRATEVARREIKPFVVPDWA